MEEDQRLQREEEERLERLHRLWEYYITMTDINGKLGVLKYMVKEEDHLPDLEKELSTASDNLNNVFCNILITLKKKYGIED